MLFPAASLTDPIVQFAVDVIDKLGLPGIFVLMVAESACIPIPSEATFLFAGFNVANGEYSMLAVVAVGTFANVVGSWIAYAVGYYGRVDILEKHGEQAPHQAVATCSGPTDWFEKYGSWTVFLTRMLPIIRTFISLPAGVARMPFWRFTVLTTLGCIPWIFMLTFIGREAGDRWEDWKDSLHYVDYAIAAMIVAGVVYLLVRNRRSRARSPRRPVSRPPMRRTEVVALGLLQGPAELLPVSSSGHVAALPWLLGWEHAQLDGARRKEVEVALHAGGAVALLVGLRRRADGAADRRRRALAAAGRGARVRGRALDRDAPRRPALARGGAGGGLGRRSCWPTARRRSAGRRTPARATGCCSGSRRRARSCRASRAPARRWRRRGRSGSRGPTRCGSRAASASRCWPGRRR